MRYASKSKVSSDRSQGEIRSILSRYGATRFGYLEEADRALVMFEIANRRVRFVLPLPNRTAREFTHTKTRGSLRAVEEQHRLYEQATRQRWRALTLAIKAKLEAVESGIATFEDEFMAYVMLPSGQTVGEWMQPQIARSYESGKMPPLMLTAGVRD